MNRYYYTEIENLRSRLILMGERASEILTVAVDSLIEQDLTKCEIALQSDREINKLDKEIGKETMRYISLRSPVASDLRMIMVAVKTASNLERIGDESISIARRCKRILAQGRMQVELVHIQSMVAATLEMLDTAKALFLRPDVEISEEVCERDSEIDRLNAENLRAFIRQAEVSPEQASVLFELAMISKSIERAADHVTNIAEDMIYLVRGEEGKP